MAFKVSKMYFPQHSSDHAQIRHEHIVSSWQTFSKRKQERKEKKARQTFTTVNTLSWEHKKTIHPNKVTECWGETSISLAVCNITVHCNTPATVHRHTEAGLHRKHTLRENNLRLFTFGCLFDVNWHHLRMNMFIIATRHRWPSRISLSCDSAVHCVSANVKLI